MSDLRYTRIPTDSDPDLGAYISIDEETNFMIRWRKSFLPLGPLYWYVEIWGDKLHKIDEMLLVLKALGEAEDDFMEPEDIYQCLQSIGFREEPPHYVR